MTATRRPVGYTITQYWCRKCVPEGVADSYSPMREGDDYGVPYSCDTCGDPLQPCDHEWDEKWNHAYTPEGQPERELRFCRKEFCGEVEYRPVAASPTHREAPQ